MSLVQSMCIHCTGVIIEWLKLNGSFKVIELQPSALNWAANHCIRLYIRMPRAPSSLDTSRDGKSTASLNNGLNSFQL